MRRAEDQSLVGHFHLERHVLGETEVDQRDAAIVAQHHVAGLEVAVKNPDFVDGLQCVRQVTRIFQ